MTGQRGAENAGSTARATRRWRLASPVLALGCAGHCPVV